MASPDTLQPRSVDQLLQEMPHLWRAREHRSLPTIRSGFDTLDQTLAGGGWPLGTLIELAPVCSGIGELTLALPALRALARARRPIAFVRPPYVPYAPALRRAGLPLKQLLWIAETDEADGQWAAEQLLRDGAGAVLLWRANADPRSLRRLQLAAEASGALAFIYRPPESLERPSPAGLRIRLHPQGEAVEVQIVKARGASPTIITLTLPWLAPLYE